MIHLSDLPVERPGGNEAAEGADASGGRAGGVAQLGFRVDRRRDDCFGDRGRVVPIRHRGGNQTVENLAPFRIDRMGASGCKAFVSKPVLV